MTQSEHFELNLVEGTDIVNPLVIDKPNYEKIDAQMFANQSATVGTATELTSNGVHAITRTHSNTNVFRFTATSRYETGDRFTVDGVDVTALLPNGKALGDGSYVVGSTVLCSLVGTLLTIYTFSIAEADDSAKLGGELPSYYATKVEVDNARTLAENAATISQENQSSIEQINIDLLEYKTSVLGLKSNQVIKRKTQEVNNLACTVADGNLFRCSAISVDISELGFNTLSSVKPNVMQSTGSASAFVGASIYSTPTKNEVKVFVWTPTSKIFNGYLSIELECIGTI